MGGNVVVADSGEALQDRVVRVSRVSKVVKGGRRFSFSASVIVGDGTKRVGFGLGKASEVPEAIRKGADQARKSLHTVAIIDGTIPFPVIGQHGSSRVLMYPATKGKGIIAGGAVRVIAELAGITDIVCKVHGTKNFLNVIRATMDGLQQMVSLEEYASYRGKTVDDFVLGGQAHNASR
ncbi:MAG: 30S ribosomal protein S5 [Pseudomonadota bacterium]|nr:30S ribosomal protein S5 [Pseudomonadota bacterium]